MAYLETDSPAVFNGNGSGFGGFDGFWGIILIALLFGWGRNGSYGFGGSDGVMNNYVLNSDFSMLSRQLSDGFNSQERKLDSISNGICSLGYDQLSQMNGINTNISNAQFNLQKAIDNVNFNSITNTNTITNAMCLNARDIIENQNANYRALHDELISNKLETKNAQIAELTSKVNALNLAQSQANQNNYLINTLRPTPTPAYVVANPYCCNCNTSCCM